MNTSNIRSVSVREIKWYVSFQLLSISQQYIFSIITFYLHLNPKSTWISSTSSTISVSISSAALWMFSSIFNCWSWLTTWALFYWSNHSSTCTTLTTSWLGLTKDRKLEFFRSRSSNWVGCTWCSNLGPNYWWGWMDILRLENEGLLATLRSAGVEFGSSLSIVWRMQSCGSAAYELWNRAKDCWAIRIEPLNPLIV